MHVMPVRGKTTSCKLIEISQTAFREWLLISYVDPRNQVENNLTQTRGSDDGASVHHGDDFSDDTRRVMV
jgi:hypothetical protein